MGKGGFFVQLVERQKNLEPVGMISCKNTNYMLMKIKKINSWKKKMVPEQKNILYCQEKILDTV